MNIQNEFLTPMPRITKAQNVESRYMSSLVKNDLGLRPVLVAHGSFKLRKTLDVQLKEYFLLIFSTQKEVDIVRNRIKILRQSQVKADKSLELAHLKSQKLEEINRLKGIEMEQNHILNVPGLDKEREMKQILKKANSICTSSAKNLPINSIFDNTIDAIKLRIEKKQYLERITKDKKMEALEKEEKHNKVVSMEKYIRQYVEKTKEKNLNRIKFSKLEYQQDMKSKVDQAYEELKSLENIETKMIRKLTNTKSMENLHSIESLKSLESIKSKQSERFLDLHIKTSNYEEPKNLIIRPRHKVQSNINVCRYYPI